MSYLADINVWLALSWGGHPHSSTAWNWFRALVDDDVLFCRFTQIGLLRLLTTKAVMGQDCLTVRKAWRVYDGWLRDRRSSSVTNRPRWMACSGAQRSPSRQHPPLGR